MLNPCPECGAASQDLGVAQTMLGFVSPPGHEHDPNRFTREFLCAAGHRRHVASYHKCPVDGCDWVSRLAK